MSRSEIRWWWRETRYSSSSRLRPWRREEELSFQIPPHCQTLICSQSGSHPTTSKKDPTRKAATTSSSSSAMNEWVKRNFFSSSSSSSFLCRTKILGFGVPKSTKSWQNLCWKTRFCPKQLCSLETHFYYCYYFFFFCLCNYFWRKLS